MAAEVIVAGADGLLAKLRAKATQIERDKDRAARSAANVFRRFIRAEAKAIRGKGITVIGTTKTGRVSRRTKHLLETRVELVRKLDGWSVKDKAPHAHLVIRGHEIVGHRPDLLHTGGRTSKNPFVHRAFIAAGHEPLIAARVVLFEGGPEVPDA